MRTISASVAWKWITAAVTVAVVVLGALYFAFVRKQAPAGPIAPMTVMIADFSNHTGDSVFNGTLESTLKLVLEGASFISAYDRTRMRDLGLKATSGALDEARAQEIAASQGLNVVVAGSFDRRGSEYLLSVRAVQTVTGKVLATADATAPNKDQVLFAVTKLGTAVRKSLGDVTSDSAQRLSMETLTAASLEAVHEYAAGLDAQSAGKFEEARQHLSRALDLDPNFGMAYTVMAGVNRNLGRHQDAEKYIREAIKHIDHMTERERYRTRAYLYLLNQRPSEVRRRVRRASGTVPGRHRRLHEYRSLLRAVAQHAESARCRQAGGRDLTETSHLPRQPRDDLGVQRRFRGGFAGRPRKR